MTDAKELDRLVAEAMGRPCTGPFRDGKTCPCCNFHPTRNASHRDEVIEWLLDNHIAVDIKGKQIAEGKRYYVWVFDINEDALASGYATSPGIAVCRAVEELKKIRSHLK